MKKVPLADVLWRAANEHLSADGVHTDNRLIESYSCPAVGLSHCGAPFVCAEIKDFLSALGCPIHSHTAFSRVAWQFTPRTQGLRYMWLLIAMHVAEDEQITMEISP